MAAILSFNIMLQLTFCCTKIGAAYIMKAVSYF